jgi:hypothetical protein
VTPLVSFSTLFADGVIGYTDYPTHDEAETLARAAS